MTVDTLKSPMCRAVGYRRVSMPEQINGHSLDAQETNIKRYAEEHGWPLVEIYVDAGISAKKGSSRPAFERLLRDAKTGKFDVVIVDKIDRFYRHLSGLLTALDQLNSCGVSFASVQEKLDFTTPWGKLMLTVLGMLAEIYIDNLRQETRKGKIQRARKGLWLGGIPYGYCNGLCSHCTDPNGEGYCPDFGIQDKGNGKVMIAHPIESRVVRMVYEKYAGGNMSHRLIAEELNGFQVSLEDGSSVPARQKGAPGRSLPGPFGRDIIRDMLKREAYTGKLPYQGIAEDGRHRKRCVPLELYQGTHTPIIDEATFLRAQEVRLLNFRNPRVKNSRVARVYPLTGIMLCGYCGGHMRGVSNGKLFYYKDGNQLDNRCECPQPIIRAQIIEERVVNWLKSVAGAAFDDGRTDDIQLQSRKIEQRYERARDLYLSGELDRSNYEIEKIRYDNDKDRLQLGTFHAKIALLEDIRPQLENWSDLSQFKRKRVFRLAIETLYLRKNALAAVQPSVAFLPLIRHQPCDTFSGCNTLEGYYTPTECNCGEGGIRTAAEFLMPSTHLAGEPNRPLWHLPRFVQLPTS